MPDNWNPNTASPSCDWCGECEWCANLHRTPAPTHARPVVSDKQTAENDQTPDPLDERYFVVSAEEWDDLHERLDRPAEVKPRLKELLEHSSFGTPEAQEARASVSDEQVERVLRGLSDPPGDPR